MAVEKCVACTMRCLSICIAVVIFLLSAQSKLPLPETVSFPGLDKLLHACAFGSLAFALSYWFAVDAWFTEPLKCFALVCCMAACYGISDEIHQIFVPGRDASLYVWVADCAGAALAAFARLQVVKLQSGV